MFVYLSILQMMIKVFFFSLICQTTFRKQIPEWVSSEFDCARKCYDSQMER